MPIPDKHVKQLQRDLTEHENRLTTVRAKMASMQEEAAAHEAVLSLGRNPALLKTMNELYDQPNLMQQVAQRPAEYLAQKGITFPPGVTLNAYSGGADSATIDAHFDQGTVKYKISWDRNAGFALAEEPQLSRVEPQEKESELLAHSGNK
jgi:hypothetical protein